MSIKEIAQTWDQIAEANKKQGQPPKGSIEHLVNLLGQEPDLVELLASGQPNRNGQKKP